MGKKTKTGKARKDKFYFLAKETGYRSRAAFKLIQLNRRFNFLNTSKVLIDLCAAPGGWLQVAAKEMPVASQIIGVDLVPIQPIPRVKTFVADITTERCKQLIRQELLQNKADVVLHDGAPNVGTAWSIDEFSQANLCLQAFALATEVLRKGGWFITKVFRSRDYEPFKWALSQFFRTVRAIKPEASRMESAEIFLVGQFYLAPDRIDHRFLDSRHVFGEVVTPLNRATIVSSFLRESKKKKKADGYADGDSLYRELRVSDLIRSADPLESLATANKVIFDMPEVENHPLTTSTLKSDLEDIQVLGKADIKNILKWRKKIIAFLESETNKNSASITDSKLMIKPDNDKVSDDEEDNELKVEEEVQRLLHEEEKQQKKRLKRVRKTKIKAAERLVLKMDHPGDRIEQEDSELFSLSTLHDLVGLEKAKMLIGDTSVTGSDALIREQEAAKLKAIRDKRNAELRTAVEGAERLRFERRGESNSIPEYENDSANAECNRDDLYLSSDTDSVADGELGGSSIRFNGSPSVPPDSDTELATISAKRKTLEKPKRLPLPSLDPLRRLHDKRNPLLVDLDDVDELTANKRKLRSWIMSNDMQNLLGPVDTIDGSDDPSDSEADDAVDLNNAKPKKKIRRTEARTANKSTVKFDEPELSKHSGAHMQPSEVTTDAPEAIPSELKGLRKLRRPLTIEERALATRLIRSAKSRRELIESGYHRMQFFEDPSELPDWFVEDERKHMRKPLPLTNEEVVPDHPTMGRSINKVEEAKMRKKARLAKRLKRVRQKAENISDDVPETEKWQQIKQMYKKAGLLGKKRRPVHFIVNTKAGARNPHAQTPKGAKIKIVDRRMKADLRGQQRGLGKKRGHRGGHPVRLLAHKPRSRSGRRINRRDGRK